MTDPDRGPKPPDEPREPPAGAQRRPGEHPEVRRSGSGRTTAVLVVAVLVGAALMYAAIALGIVTGPA